MHSVITGAADGIGLALAEQYAQRGDLITGFDIDPARSARAEQTCQPYHPDSRIIQVDLAHDWQKAIDSLTTRPPIDLFIHNAGINAVGRFATLSMAHQEEVVALNLTTPIQLTRGLLHHGLMARSSTFVFIASLSHFTSYPGAAVYAATKDGLAAYARSLGVALLPQNIHVLTVFPGPTRTAHARLYSPDNRHEHRRMPPEELANSIMRAVNRRQSRLIPGGVNRLWAHVGHYFPSLAEYAMKKLILEKLCSGQADAGVQ